LIFNENKLENMDSIPAQCGKLVFLNEFRIQPKINSLFGLRDFLKICENQPSVAVKN
jgi:hypothetical protein